MNDLTRIEFVKLLSQKKLSIFFIVGLMIEILLACQVRTIMPEGFRDSVYRYYLGNIKGKYSAEKKQYLESEYRRFQDLLQNQDEYERQYSAGAMEGTNYREILNEIKSAEYRMATLEYLMQKAEYYENRDIPADFFYDIVLGDYVEHLGTDYVALILIFLLVFPIYMDDYFAGTTAMIRSSKNGQRKLFLNRIQVTVCVSAMTSIVYSVAEFMTKYIRFDIGNLKAATGSLMIEKTAAMTQRMICMPAVEYISIIALYRIVIAIIFGMIVLLMTRYYGNIFNLSGNGK